jgi:hypothetical protein
MGRDNSQRDASIASRSSSHLRRQQGVISLRKDLLARTRHRPGLHPSRGTATANEGYEVSVSHTS